MILIFRERSAKNLGKGLATPTSKTTKTTRTIKTAAPKRSILKTPGREPSKMRKTLIFASPITSARSTRLGADLSYEDSGSCVSWEEEGGNV